MFSQWMFVCKKNPKPKWTHSWKQIHNSFWQFYLGHAEEKDDKWWHSLLYLIESKSMLADSFEGWTQSFVKLITMGRGWICLKRWGTVSEKTILQGVKTHGQQAVDKTLPVDKWQPRADRSWIHWMQSGRFLLQS